MNENTQQCGATGTPCPECELLTPGTHYRNCTLLAELWRKEDEAARREAEARYADVLARLGQPRRIHKKLRDGDFNPDPKIGEE